MLLLGWAACLFVCWLVGWLVVVPSTLVCLFFFPLTLSDAPCISWWCKRNCGWCCCWGLVLCLLCFLLPPPFSSPEFFSCSVQFSLAGELWSRWLCCCLCRESVCSCFGTPISCQLQLPHYQSLTGKYSLLLDVCSLNAKCLTQNLAAQKSLLVMKQEFDSAAGCWMSKK